MSFSDLMDAHEVLDLKDYIKAKELKKIESKRISR
jgi:hypothetical protein